MKESEKLWKMLASGPWALLAQIADAMEEEGDDDDALRYGLMWLTERGKHPDCGVNHTSAGDIPCFWWNECSHEETTDFPGNELPERLFAYSSLGTVKKVRSQITPHTIGYVDEIKPRVFSSYEDAWKGAAIAVGTAVTLGELKLKLEGA